MASSSTARSAQVKSALTPRESAIGTPTGAADSPERANKRARFNAAAAVAGTGTPRDASWTPGHAKSDGDESDGVRWVKARITEMQAAYKEAMRASVLIMQHRIYSRKLGLQVTRLPIHMTRRLDRARAKYEALRRLVEVYLLQCAQAASTPSKPLTSLPTPGTLPGLTPLPKTPHPLGATALLGFDPANPTTQLEKLAAQQLPMSMSGVPAFGGVAGVGNGNGMMGIGAGNGAAAVGGAAGGVIDMSSLGMAELNALINGDGFDFAALANAGMVNDGSDPLALAPGGGGGMLHAGGGGEGPGANADAGMGFAGTSQSEAEQLLAALGEMEAMGPGDSAMHDASKISAETIDSLLASLPGGGVDGGEMVDFGTLGMAGEAGLGELDLSEFAGLFESGPVTASGTPGGFGEMGQGQGQGQGQGGVAPASGQGVAGAQGQQMQQGQGQGQSQSGQSGQAQGEGNQASARIPVPPPQQQQQQEQQTVEQGAQSQEQSRNDTAPPPQPPAQQSGATNNNNNSDVGASLGSAAPTAPEQLAPSGVPASNDLSTTNPIPAPAPAPALAETGAAVGPIASAPGTAPVSGAPSLFGGTDGEMQYDLSGFDNELEGFKFDDYNFGDGTMPATDGDEFESMFAEFK